MRFPIAYVYFICLILCVRSLLDIEELTRRLAKRTFWVRIALYSHDETAIHGRIRSLRKGLLTFGVRFPIVNSFGRSIDLAVI